MVGADVAVAWIDKNTGKGYAEDYYLDAKAQCSGQKGSCPDTRLGVSFPSIPKLYILEPTTSSILRGLFVNFVTISFFFTYLHIRIKRIRFVY